MRIDGREMAQKILDNLQEKVILLKKQNITPHLVVILIGNDAASKAYVGQKKLKAKEIGAKITVYNFSYSISMKKILSCLNDLNHLNKVHGIIVQRPIPKHLDSDKINKAIDPKKDVDAFRKDSFYQMPLAAAVLGILEEVFLQCYPEFAAGDEGSRFFAKSDLAQNDKQREFKNWLKSKQIVVIGKGETGGGTVISLLQKMGVQPKIIDSKTKEPEKITKNADVIISAVGKSNVVRSEFLKPGVILISIGLHKENDGKLYGDYEENKIKDIASFYTPTPGGVGPVNVAMLLSSLIAAAEKATEKSKKANNIHHVR